MRLRATRAMRVAIRALGLRVSVRGRRGDAHRDQRQVPAGGLAGARAAGFKVTRRYTDPAGDFALTLASPLPVAGAAG